MFRQDLWPVQHTHTLPHIFSLENRTWGAILAILASSNILRALLSPYSGSHFLFFFSPLSIFYSHYIIFHQLPSSVFPSLAVSGDIHFRHRCHVDAVIGSRPCGGKLRMRIHWPGPWQAVNSPYATLHGRGKHTLHAELQESTLTQTHQSSAVENFAHYRI